MPMDRSFRPEPLPLRCIRMKIDEPTAETIERRRKWTSWPRIILYAAQFVENETKGLAKEGRGGSGPYSGLDRSWNSPKTGE